MPATTESLIRKTPNVMGGEACIRRTRIAVWMMVNKRFRLGMTEAEILEGYPEQLTAEDLAASWDYYATHTQEIDDAIRRNEELEPDEMS